MIAELDMTNRMRVSAWASFEDECTYIFDTHYKYNDFEPLSSCFKRFVLCRAEKAEKAMEITQQLIANLFDKMWDSRLDRIRELGGVPEPKVTTKPKPTSEPMQTSSSNSTQSDEDKDDMEGEYEDDMEGEDGGEW